MGSHGHRVNFDAAHDWACILNTIQGMGSVGTVFHACCLLETTTFRFPITTLPIVAHSHKPQGRFNWLLPQVIALPYAFLQESSAPRADEHAIWDTLRSRKPGSLRAMPSQFETSCAI